MAHEDDMHRLGGLAVELAAEADRLAASGRVRSSPAATAAVDQLICQIRALQQAINNATKPPFW